MLINYMPSGSKSFSFKCGVVTVSHIKPSEPILKKKVSTSRNNLESPYCAAVA